MSSRESYRVADVGMVNVIRFGYWTERLFWVDNAFAPINRLIGCRLFGHRPRDVEWSDDEDNFCLKCYRQLLPTPPSEGA